MPSALTALLLLLASGAAFCADQAVNVQHINPSTLSAPHGYTHVVTVDGGRTVYIAGQVPFDKSGKLVGSGNFAAQVRQTFENLKAALAAGGANFSNVVDMTTYVADMSQIDTYRKIRGEYMTDPLPAASMVEVKALFRPDVMLEISVVAVVPVAPSPQVTDASAYKP
ncbi:RidA family protein [Dyella psychrodurans]|uniref:RidA family protein n=1 Tax=Dyella psychrodurans TaxID=1927960 RepID=A0A370X2T9_9GAMM|nr:RidA family protein [Dyella psychrodurans]RDS82709.1 RidA family protein [Dyella psychrodurans]